MTGAADRLRQAAALVDAGQPVDADLGNWLVDWLTEQRSAERRRANRDRHIVSLRVQYYGDLSAWAAAVAIAADAKSYTATSWVRDRDAETTPTRLTGTPRAALWKALRTGIDVPTTPRRIYDILQTTCADAS